MLVSILVVTYNQSQIVGETLNSIFEQTYSPLELIVSDDCSKDNTVEVVKKWVESHKERFASVQVLDAKVNQGVTANCNKGVRAASGTYLQLIAGDDILLPTAIEEKAAFAEANGLNYVVCKTEPFGDSPEKVAEIAAWCEKGYDIIRRGHKAQLDEILRFNFYAGPCGSFFKLDWFKEFGAFDERYPMMEDYPFIFRYIVAGNEIKLLERTLTRYRVYQGSLSSSVKSPMWKSNWRFFFRECFPVLIRMGKLKTIAQMLNYYVYSRFFKGTAFDRAVIKKLGKLLRSGKR